jgi:spoIIIJ-associated protein
VRSAVGTGKTIEEAVQDALARLGARPDEVELRKLEDPSTGLMGNAPRPARVRATWREGLGPAAPEAAAPAERTVLGAPRAFSGEESSSPGGRPSRGDRPERGDRGPRRERGERGGRGGREGRGERSDRGDRGDRGGRESRPRRPHTPLSPEERFNVDDAFLARVKEETSWLLSRMGFDATVEVEGVSDEVLVGVKLSDDDEPLVTGRRGDTRVAFTQVLSRLVNPKRGPGAHLIVDVNGFWRDRRDGLRDQARSLADRALESGEEVVTEPLSSEERRIIHRALNDDARVVTESYGDGAMKRVAIRPA